MALVFQYGSNCSVTRLNGKDRLNGAARVVGVAETVEDYALAFDVWSARNNCAASNIVPTPGHKVWGVLYDVPDERMSSKTCPSGTRSFDAIEGPAYRRQTIQVRRPDGSVVEAVTYVVRQPLKGLRSSLEYVRHIVRGLREQGVAEGYIREVKEIAAMNNPEIAEGIKGL
jgi:gamma-glutamylcyclotransferase